MSIASITSGGFSIESSCAVTISNDRKKEQDESKEIKAQAYIEECAALRQRLDSLTSNKSNNAATDNPNVVKSGA